MAVARFDSPLGQILGRREVVQRGEPVRRASASAGSNLGNHIFSPLFVTSDYQYVSASGCQRHGCGPADTARGTLQLGLVRPAGSDQAGLVGEDHELGPISGAEFAHRSGGVGLGRRWA